METQKSHETTLEERKQQVIEYMQRDDVKGLSVMIELENSIVTINCYGHGLLPTIIENGLDATKDLLKLMEV